MNGQPNRINNRKYAPREMTSRTLRQPKMPVRTLESYEGNLADELSTVLAQPVQFAELPAVAPEEFESLFTWFIS